MRQVISISLPQALAKKIKIKAKKRGYTTLSSYFHYLATIDDENESITEDELALLAKAAQKRYEKGKWIEADSLQDLL